MKPYKNLNELITSQHSFSGTTIHNFKSKAEQEASYYNQAGVNELIRLYETAVKPFYDERIRNLEVTIEVKTEWIAQLKEVNEQIEKIYKKSVEGTKKLMQAVDEEYKDFVIHHLPVMKYHLPLNYKTPAEAEKLLTEDIEVEKSRLIDVKGQYRYFTNLYNKAKQALKELV